MGRKPTGRSSKTVRVPVQYELLVKNYIFGLKQGDALVSLPIELEATGSDDIQPLRMGNLIEPTSEAQAIVEQRSHKQVNRLKISKTGLQKRLILSRT